MANEPTVIDCGFNPPAQDPKLPQRMGVKEVAAFAGVSLRTIGRWIRLGRFSLSRLTRLGRSLRFRREDVLETLDRYEDGPPPANDPRYQRESRRNDDSLMG